MMNTQYTEENNQDPQRLQDCFKRASLQHIVAKAHHLLALDKRLQEILTPEYRGHCQIMNLESTTLVVGVDNAAWATRLRYQAQDILSQLKASMPELIGVTVLEVRVKVAKF